jgi:hypothetical protein
MLMQTEGLKADGRPRCNGRILKWDVSEKYGVNIIREG